MRYDAFFRFYSKDDLLLVSQDIRTIIDDGYSILIESSETKSELIEAIVEEAINDSSVMVFFMPVNTNLSETSFLDEMNYADMKGIKTICVLHEQSENKLKELPYDADNKSIHFVYDDYSSALKQFRLHIAAYTELNQSPDASNTSLEHIFTLGKFHYLTEDYGQAAIHFRLAASQGYAPAQFQLAHLYMYGRGCDRSDIEAEKWLINAANQDYAPAQFELACNYIVGHGFKKDYNEALRWLQNAAELGNSQAQVFLGQLYYKGTICEQDYSQAAFWFVSAAIHGNKKAQYELGKCYLSGYGVSRNFSEALKWLTFSAEKNYPDAAFVVGLCHENLFNFQEALKWYMLAAEKGFTPAHCKIGDMYVKGMGVTKNHQEAVKWYRSAAELGSSTAKELLNQLNDTSAVNKCHIARFYEILRKILKVISKKMNAFLRFMK